MERHKKTSVSFAKCQSLLISVLVFVLASYLVPLSTLQPALIWYSYRTALKIAAFCQKIKAQNEDVFKTDIFRIQGRQFYQYPFGQSVLDHLLDV